MDGGNRVRAVGDIWSSVGSIFQGLGTIAGSVIPIVLGPGNQGGGGNNPVVANPNNPGNVQDPRISQGASDGSIFGGANGTAILYGILAVGVLLVVSRRKGK